MNSTITVASVSSSSSGAYCSSPRSPLDDIEVHSPLRPTRRIGVARSFSSPTSLLEKDRHSLNRLYHHQQRNNACSLFDLLEAGWEDTKRIKNRANKDFISSNNKNKQLAMSLTKFQFWSEIEDLTSEIDSSINSKDGAAPPPSPATVEEQEDEHEEQDSAAVDDLLDLAFDCDFQDSFNLESCRMKRRCHRNSGRGRHSSSSDMTRQDHHLLLDEISISEPFSSEYDDDDDEISIAEEEEDAKMQTTVSSFAEHDSSYDIDISHADEDELSLDNTTLQTDKEYDEVHIDEDDDDPHDDFAVTMTDVVMDVALDADFGSRDSVKIKMCHRAQLQNDRNRQKITSRSSTL
jgi:hypothetical protein